MTEACASIVYRESRQLDRIDDEKTVHSMAGGFYGAWLCQACGIGDVNVLMSNTEEDAAAMAREGAEGHHRVIHRPPAGP